VIRALLIALLALTVCACSSKKAPAVDHDGIDAEACNARGGEVRGVCLTNYPACVVPFSDAGRRCRDSSECLGMCLVPEEELDPIPDPGTPMEGRCQSDNDPCGCFFEVKDGLVQQGLCAD
jgi:hypothetical protein